MKQAQVIQAVELLRHAALLGLVISCVYTDLAKGKVYNWATISGLVLGLATAYILDGDPRMPGYPHLISSAWGIVVGGGIFLLLHFVGGMGAGDVKLVAAVGALAPFIRGRVDGLSFMLVALMYTALVGAAIALCILIWKRQVATGLRESVRTLFTFRVKRADGAPVTTMPYAVAIGAGVLWAWIEVMIP